MGTKQRPLSSRSKHKRWFTVGRSAHLFCILALWSFLPLGGLEIFALT